MSGLVLAVSIFGVLGSLVWVINFVLLAHHRDRIVFLNQLPIDPPRDGWPSLAVVFAARDESAMVEAATRSMLALDYPGLEVIAVDDRSTDTTGAILDSIATDEPDLKVVHVKDLPPGWLGKTHALQLGSDVTEALWVLFTDGDVLFHPEALKQAVGYAESEEVDHVTVGPGVPAESVGERIFLGFFELVFLLTTRFQSVADQGSKAHIGIGAFNLVRQRTFRDVGGFRRIALSVDDDLNLGKILKFAGYRSRLLLGQDAVTVRWQTGLGSMIRGLEKNFFAATGFSVAKSLAGTVFVAMIGIAPFAGLFVGPDGNRIASALGVAALAATMFASSRQSGIPWYYAFSIPLGATAVLVALWRSIILTISRDGVRWRGHHYPLADLRRHLRMRDAWTREVWKSTR
jgi:glycosyltransferase involved in cell wall biosynthesis